MAELASNPTLREAVHDAMKAVGDLERLSARATQGRAGVRELVALRRSLEALPGVQRAVASCESLVLREHAGEITPAPELAAVLRAALVEDPPASRDAGAIKPGFDAELDGIREASRSRARVDRRRWRRPSARGPASAR